MTIITPEKELILPKTDDTEQEGIKIPTDPEGIKKLNYNSYKRIFLFFFF